MDHGARALVRRVVAPLGLLVLVAGCGREGEAPAPVTAETRAALGSRLEVAEAAFRVGDYPAAAGAYREAIELLPPVEQAAQGAQVAGVAGAAEYRSYLASVHDNLGVVLLRMRRFGEAGDAIEEAIEIDPGRALFHANLGTSRLRSKRFDEAATSFERALEIEPGQADLLVRLGETYAALGRTGDAVRTLERALDSLPDPDLEGLAVDARLALGAAYAERGELERAVDALARAIQAAPGTAEAWYQLSRVLHRSGRGAEAEAAAERFERLSAAEERLEAFRSLPALDREQTRAYAALLRALGLPHQALVQVRKLVASTPGDPCTWLEQGRLLESLGAADGAASSYRRALERVPGCPQAVAGLGRLGVETAAAAPGSDPAACCPVPLLALAQPEPEQERDQERRQ